MFESCTTCIHARAMCDGHIICSKMNVFVFDSYCPTQEFFVCKGKFYESSKEKENETSSTMQSERN